jgi:hypothetical protein
VKIPVLGIILGLLAAMFIGGVRAQHSHEGTVGKFYETWMMPDAPKTSCCHGEDCAPAASRFVGGKWQAQDPSGVWVEIPAYKIEQNRDSPDGRSHLCGRKVWSGFAVFCFVRGGGT